MRRAVIELTDAATGSVYRRQAAIEYMGFILFAVAALLGLGKFSSRAFPREYLFAATVIHYVTAVSVAILVPLVVITIVMGLYPKPVLDVTSPSVAKLITDNKMALALDQVHALDEQPGEPGCSKPRGVTER